MNKVTFKTLDAEKVYHKLMAVADRLHVLEDVVDKVWNDIDTCHVLPVLKDAQNDLAELYFDMKEWKGDKLAIINE